MSDSFNSSIDIIQKTNTEGAGNYPFSDIATMTSREGVFVVPTAFSDVRLYATVATANQYISRITINFNTTTIEIKDDNGLIGTATITNNNASTPVAIIDPYSRQVGVLLGNFDQLRSISPSIKVLTFNPEALPFVPSVITPQPQVGVRSLVDKNNEIVTSDVWLVGEDGVVLTVDGNTITVHISADPLYRLKACTSEIAGYVVPRPLKTLTVNGHVVTPDDTGNINFVVGDTLTNFNNGSGMPFVMDNLLRITPASSGLQFSIIGNFQ